MDVHLKHGERKAVLEFAERDTLAGLHRGVAQAFTMDLDSFDLWSEENGEENGEPFPRDDTLLCETDITANCCLFVVTNPKWALRTKLLTEGLHPHLPPNSSSLDIDFNGETALHLFEGNLEATELLIRAGADTEAVSWHGFTPLEENILNGHVECVRLFLAVPGVELSPHHLYDALKCGFASLAHLLLDHDVPLPGNRETLRLATVTGDLHLVYRLIDRGLPVKAVPSILNDVPEIFVDVLLAAGAKPDEDTMFEALKRGHVSAARKLASAGAPLNRLRDDVASIVLHQLRLPMLPPLSFLDSLGCDLSTRGPYGRTALHWAVSLGCERTVASLLSPPFSVDVGAVDAAGLTPLHVAVGASATYSLSVHGTKHAFTPCFPQASMVRLLMSNGADPSCVDANGISALDHAAKCSRGILPILQASPRI